MYKTILLPTDFSIESLNVLKSVIQDQPDNEELNIILLHGMHLTDSITELMFFSKPKALAPLISSDFREACDVIRNKYYSKVRSIREELFTGYNQRAFDIMMGSLRVDEIYLPDGFRFTAPGKRSFDTIPFLRKCKVPVKTVTWKSSPVVYAKGQVAEIFFENALFQ